MKKNIVKSKVRSAVLVSPCILSPGFQAERKAEKHWGYAFIELLMKYEVDIIPMPCPESAFGGFSSGLQRGKHGIDYYLSLDGYQEHCMRLAQQSAARYADLSFGGYQFICMLGVEHSPSCAVNYLYSQHGTLKRLGIFFELLQEKLDSRNLSIPQVGINRKYPRKALELLEQKLSALKEIEAGKDDIL